MLAVIILVTLDYDIGSVWLFFLFHGFLYKLQQCNMLEMIKKKIIEKLQSNEKN